MPKFGCTCGRVIDLSRIPFRYGGKIVRNLDWDRTYEAFFREATRFVEAVAEGRQDAWMEERFGPGFSKRRLYESVYHDVLFDLFMDHVRAHQLEVLQCEACGRIWIEDERDTKYRPFRPEGR